jgi:CubicO group peptidase (beta-lactamase class C family)
LRAPDSVTDELSRLARRIQRDSRLPSLSCAVSAGREVVWEESIGLALVEEEREATPDTQYRVASITKTFTACAVMQLRDAGKLSLEDPLTKHIAEAAHAPTIRGCITHLSGLQREPAGAMWETLQAPERAQLLAELGEAEQILAPGEAWHYSNLAYALLGEVVERVAGMPYTKFVSERLLEPLGLERTTWSPVEPAARGYFVEPYADAVKLEPELDLRGAAAAGQLASTARDLACWGAFLADPDPKILRPETVQEMHQPHSIADEAWTLSWGLGPMLIRRDDRVFGGHTGGYPGFATIFLYSRKEKICVVLLSNSGVWDSAYEDGGELATKAVDLLAKPEPWRPEPQPPPEVEPLLGHWWSEGVETIFSYRGGRLEARLASAPEREPSVFVDDGDDRYRAVSGRERGEVLRVIRDDDGRPVKLYWATYPFTRAPRILGGPEPPEG